MIARCLALAALTVGLSCQAADLTLEVTGLDTTRLQGASLMVAVYAAPESWLRKPAVGKAFTLGPDAASGAIKVQLKDLPEGPLALAVYQDANGNGQLDSNAMGMPIEPFGFSNDAAGNFGPPKFEQAVLKAAAGSTVRIRLN